MYMKKQEAYSSLFFITCLLLLFLCKIHTHGKRGEITCILRTVDTLPYQAWKACSVYDASLGEFEKFCEKVLPFCIHLLKGSRKNHYNLFFHFLSSSKNLARPSKRGSTRFFMSSSVTLCHPFPSRGAGLSVTSAAVIFNGFSSKICSSMTGRRST